MALTALEIYKHLPKTNCRECGFPTCLAFAMQLAAKRASLDQCPYVTEEAKAALEGASAPPMRLVTVGAGDKKKLEIGNETVLFRHEEKFYHPLGIAIEVRDDLPDEEVEARVKYIDGLKFERVGTEIEVDLVAVRNASGDPERFRAVVEKAHRLSRFPLILISGDPEALRGGADAAKDGRPLLYAANKDNWEQVGTIAKEFGCPLTVYGEDLEELAELTQKLLGMGVQDLVLDPGTRHPREALERLTLMRRLALKKNFRPLGYPTIAFTNGGDPYAEAAEASVYVAKYAGMLVLQNAETWQVLPLLTERYNIYTDPQKPIQVEPGVYEVGEVTDTSPVLVTTNFSLTYYTVAGDVEASRVPSYIIVVDTEGTSVLTAWAADKFTPEKVAEMLNERTDIKDKVRHRKVVIPGLVAVMTAKLREESGWDVLVGPRESSGIPKFLKAWAV
ncbi:MAG TPA: acetyl-CoA decarbonylase/synthase complex subunit gamma [Candidatus Latescibacteria bacterium]|nr:acetyl-CoA decarbonylase/synthase complex subunit gamma [Candidatus Latescibacterota bacterium]